MDERENQLDSFEKILSTNSMFAVYQPIVSLKTGRVFALEGLGRGPMGGEYESPLALIREARQRGQLWQLEKQFRMNILQAACEQGYEGKLFINVDPLILLSPAFQAGMTKHMLQRFGFRPHQIVFELTERSAVDHPGTLQKAIEYYRDQGYGVAIDDTGAGYANLLLLARTKPDYVKIDREIISGLDQDRYKRSIVAALVELSRRVGFQLIAEGIETEMEAEAVYRLGITMGQGYYYAKPKVKIAALIEGIEADLDTWIRRLDKGETASPTLGAIVDQQASLPAATSCSQAQALMKEGNLYGMPLLVGKKPTGYINHAILGQTLAKRYGYAYYANRPVSMIADTQFLALEADTPIETAADLAMKREVMRVYDDIIVTRDGDFFGCVSVRRLLDHTTRLAREEAAAMNPLTYLPGNRQIHRELDRFFSTDAQHAVIHFDLNRFKVYNDRFGFEQGDRMIRKTALLLKEIVVYDHGGFLGHIGGDDFLAILPMEEDCVERICQTILRRHMDEVLEGPVEEGKEMPGSLACAGVVARGLGMESEAFHRTMTRVKQVAKQSGLPNYQFVSK